VTPPAKADLSEIRRAIAVLYRPGDVIEVRAPKAGRDGTISGYFDDPEQLALAVYALDGKAPGVYLTLSPLRPELLARARNRLEKAAAVGLSPGHAAVADADRVIEARPVPDGVLAEIQKPYRTPKCLDAPVYLDKAVLA